MGISRNPLYSRVAGVVVTLLTVVASGAPARAVVINISDGDPAIAGAWNVVPTLVPADTNFNLFKANYITSQPWNGSKAIAAKFATALGGLLNFPNDGTYGPFFAWKGQVDPGGSSATYSTEVGVSNSSGVFSGVLPFELSSTDPWAYARATREPSTVVPGPLPVLGGMAAFCWSRRLRRRVSLVTRP
jgi:hypothetical protein